MKQALGRGGVCARSASECGAVSVYLSNVRWDALVGYSGGGSAQACASVW